MEFRVLGSLEADAGSGPVVLRAAKQRALLGVLLCHAGERVSLDRLCYALWGDDPPQAAADNLRQYVLQVRRALGDPGRIVRRPGGYALLVRPGELDANRFEALAAEGQDALSAGDVQRAAAVLREALALWRGPAYADLDDIEVIRNEAARLGERRLAALEARVDADIALGRHAELISELTRTAREHPLRERAQAQLMIALYRSGRQSDALAVYRRTRRTLSEELGLEPGPELRRLEQAILAGDPKLDGPLAPAPAPAVPALLPADIAGFTGRTAELARLEELWDARTPPTAMVISAIAGTAGVGKTALAIRWAHSLRPAFPDGQLYVNLRGYDPEQPMTAEDALAGFLRSLGVRSQDIPVRLDDQAARYRSELAGRRMLVVLDNAASAEQIRPLLPGTPGCLVIVTSRDSLPSLVALHGAHRLELGLLPTEEGLALLRALVGSRVDAEPDAAAALVAACAGLPLALRIAAEQAAGRPSARLGALVTELAGQRRLDALAAGDDTRAAVRSVFSWSYRNLPPAVAGMFRLLGHHPGAEFSDEAAAALAETATEAPSRLLTALARAHLIEPAGPGRWTMHDLLHAYAAELAQAEGTEAAGRAATRRLAHHYLTGAADAAEALQPTWRHEPGAEQRDVASAWAWLDAERTNLVAIAGTCGDQCWDSDMVALARTLFHYLDAAGHFADGEAIHTHAYEAARRVDDAAAQATSLANLGRVYRREGQLSRAAATYEQALTIYAQLTDRRGEAYARRNLGSVHWRQGRYELAAGDYRQAIALYRESADLAGQADALRSLALLDERQGRLPAATDQLTEALSLYRQIGDSSGEAYVQSSLGRIQHRDDDLSQAAAKLEENLVRARRTGDRTAEAYALTDLACAYRHQGLLGEAAAELQNAVACLRHIGDAASEVEALNELGEILRALGSTAEASAAHSAALQRAESIGDRYEEARAHNGIAAICHEACDTEAAEQHWRLALDRYREVDVPDADEVRSRLLELASECGGTAG